MRWSTSSAAKWKEIDAEKKNALLLGCITSRWKYHGLRVRQGLESVSVTVTSGEVWSGVAVIF